MEDRVCINLSLIHTPKFILFYFYSRMKYLSASIFGDFKRPIDTKGNKKLVYSLIQRPLYERPEIVQYYPAHEQMELLFKRLRNYGLYRDEALDFKEEMERMRNVRGKFKGKKGDEERKAKKAEKEAAKRKKRNEEKKNKSKSEIS